MKLIHPHRSLLLVAAALVACTGTPQAAERVRVAKALGSKQCEGGGTPLPALQRQLEQGGVKVARASCADDGRMRVAMCGAADGRLGVFEIAAADLKAAAALGFSPLKEGEGAAEQPCR